MPLVAAIIQKEMESSIMSALSAEFANEASADVSSHKRIASAVAKGVTTTLIKALQTQAQVLPGIPTAGSPASQISVGSGTIF